MFSPLSYISGFNQTHLWRRSRHDWLFVYILANDMTSFIQPLTYITRSSKQQNSRHNIKDKTYTILNNTENWITLTSIKTRGEIRCTIANTRVNHSKKAKLNIMHVTVNFLGLFFSDRQNIFRSDKIFMFVNPNDWQLLSKFREVWSCVASFSGLSFFDWPCANF